MGNESMEIPFISYLWEHFDMTNICVIVKYMVFEGGSHFFSSPLGSTPLTQMTPKRKQICSNTFHLPPWGEFCDEK